jgi:hypothetical protein
LNLRTVTQAISDTVFNISGDKYHFYDVSGLKFHRTQWVSYFDKVHSVLFVTSLSCYDQMLAEDATINRMADAIVLFHQMVNHPLLKERSFVLFLNKQDIYTRKIRKIPIKKYFPEYSGRNLLTKAKTLVYLKG